MEKRNRIQSITSFDCQQKLDVGAQLADLKIHFYHQSLLVTALIDLLIDKGIVRRGELSEVAMGIDKELMLQIESQLEKGP
jgi:hypothetical protein